MNAPIKFFGGKGTMFNEIFKYFPQIETYTTYIEPFGGSFSLGLKLNPRPPIQVYNDLDKNVYSLYKVLSDSELFEAFKERCDVVFYSEDIRSEFKEKLKDETLSIADLGVLFLLCESNITQRDWWVFKKSTYKEEYV